MLSPGPHFVLVEHPEGGSPFTHRVEITPGGSIELVVHLGPARGGTEPQRPPSIATEKRLAALTPVATRDDTRSLPPTRESAPPVWPRNVGWIAAGVAGASLAFATYEWSIKEGKFKEYNNKSNACGVVPPSQHCQNLVADGNRAKHLGLAGFIAGGAFAVGAVGLFLWSAGALDGSKPHHTALSCTSLLGDVGASCGWRF